jgi:tRNA pseudouridine38-40 synthase
MPRYVIDVCYKGTAYAGWQVQPNCITVQGEVDAALSRILQTPIATYGAGRTDSGVHALKLPAHFDFEGELPKHFMFALNALLPKDISVTKAYRALRDDFHVRFGGRARAYRYQMIFRKDPIRYGFSRWIKENVNVEAMQSAAKVLLEYDSFECFCKTNSNNKTYICNLTHSYFEWEGDMLVYHIRANRFLRGMVRAIMGTLLMVGKGQLTEDGLRKIIESKDRTKAGMSELADGLFLSEVEFEEGSLQELSFNE